MCIRDRDIKAVIAGERPLPELPEEPTVPPRRVNLIIDIQERMAQGKGPALSLIHICEGFSEDGNLVTRDLLYDAATNKQYITVETNGGSTFYLSLLHI